MPTRGRLTWNIDDYLEQLVQAGENVNDVVTTLLDSNRDYFGGLMYHYLRSTSETWTGETAKTLFVDPVKHDGNFIYVEFGADLRQSAGAFYKEYGSARQAAEPFLRPTLIFLRRTQLRKLMEQLMTKMGVQK